MLGVAALEEAAAKEHKLEAEISAARKENELYLRRVEQAKAIKAMEEKVLLLLLPLVLLLCECLWEEATV